MNPWCCVPLLEAESGGTEQGSLSVFGDELLFGTTLSFLGLKFHTKGAQYDRAIFLLPLFVPVSLPTFILNTS